MINLTPYSRENSLTISMEDYTKFVHLNDNGWSHSSSKVEFLAKLHYLRDGFAKGKISEIDFHKREEKIVINYWNKGS